jgi:hypothetical protein
MSFKESLLEVLWIIKSCLTTIWFWIPILYAFYAVIQLWLIFFVHPLSLLIVPAILCFYAIREEEKRLKLQYNICKTKRLEHFHPIGIGPQFISDSDIKQSVEEYLRLVKKEKEK